MYDFLDFLHPEEMINIPQRNKNSGCLKFLCWVNSVDILEVMKCLMQKDE